MMTRDIVLAVERIANVAKATRSLAERAKWSAKSLSKVTGSFDTALTPLRHTAGRSASGLVQQSPESDLEGPQVDLEEDALAMAQ